MSSPRNYSDPVAERYVTLGATAFNGGTAVLGSWLGYPGKKGIVRDILARVTTGMAGTTSVPEVRVGTASSDNSFARWLLGTTAILGLVAGTYRARTLCQNAAGRTGGTATQLQDFAHHITLEGNDGGGTVSNAADTRGFAYIQADTAFFITGIVGVGTPAGVADVYVDIDWW
jgi:hypothetical protein